MKKFYATALAALCVFGVSAGINDVQLHNDVVKKVIPQSALSISKPLGFSLEKAAADKVASRASEERKSIEGEYTIYIGDLYLPNGLGHIKQVASIKKDGNGDITIDSEYFPTPVTASYNEATGVITFVPIKFGETNYAGQKVYLRFEPFVYTVGEDKGNAVLTNYEVTFDAETGEIAFPADHGFSWVAYSDNRYKKKVGYAELFDVEGFVPYEEVDPNEGWTTVGSAFFEDAWITPAYSWEDGEEIAPEETPITAVLQQNDATPTLYRLVNPYYDPYWVLFDTNQSTKDGYIVFDIADPDHVIVKAGYPAGYKNGNGEFYVFGMLGWQIWKYGSDWDDEYLPELYAFMEKQGQPFDTYKDDVVTVNRSVFDISPKCTKARSWEGAAYVVSTITLDIDPNIAGVSVVEADENAPVEYFNLQGLRVDHPAAGQIVIKRQGAKVTKTIVR
ncbi:MAG: hypothetical protein K2J10_10465 [Muribaculaceae bacterium]|nr:hypothetical protein [Muribaculaceae bacterium]